MTIHNSRYGFSAGLALPYDKALERVRQALQGEGFGVLTEIDVKKTLKEKLDVDFRPYIILGACNPPLAHRALSEELEIGLLLPCNVVVHASDAPNRSVVVAIDPVAQLELSGNKAVEPVAREVREKLRRVLEAAAT